MSKSLYGLLESALTFYHKLRAGLLEGNGFGETASYDTCVSNNMVNRKQMTVIWRIDYPKVSHVDKNENAKFSE